MRKLIFIALSFLFLVSCTTNIYNTHHKAPLNNTNHIANAYRSVALLTVKNLKGGVISATGFAYDKDRILTAGHFCLSALKIQIFESHTNDIKMVHYDDVFNLITKNNVEIYDIYLRLKIYAY